MPSDFFQSQFGNYTDLPFWRKREWGTFVDTLYEGRLESNTSFRALPERITDAPKLRVLLAGVEVPSRRADLEEAMRQMSRTRRHQVETRSVFLHNGKGKFQNINLGLQDVDLNQYDWLIVLDDDIALPPNFLDNFLYLAEQAELKICQPAHRFHSYQSYAITQRQWNSLVRTTHYVECGPVTAFRRDVFPLVFPFPELRWAWGNDLAWSQYGREHNFLLGVVDATPIGHLRPVAASYDSSSARLEGENFLTENGITCNRREALQTDRVYTSLPTQGWGVPPSL
jgi:hypothetical protein